MKRMTIKRDGKNVIPLLMAACGIDLPYWRIDKADSLHSYLSGDAADRLAAYEEAEEQGLLIRLPCKVGDTVWDKKAEPWTVVSIEWFSRKVTQLHCKSPVTGYGYTFSVGKRSLGKTVFLTREEAEAALREEMK